MLVTAQEIYMTKYHQMDYYTRCWCLVEALAGRLRRTLVDRTGPFVADENLHWYRQFEQLTNRLDNDPAEITVAAFQELVRSAACSVEADRDYTSAYVQKIVERVYCYRENPRALDRDRVELHATAKRDKIEAVNWGARLFN